MRVSYAGVKSSDNVKVPGRPSLHNSPCLVVLADACKARHSICASVSSVQHILVTSLGQLKGALPCCIVVVGCTCEPASAQLAAVTAVRVPGHYLPTALAAVLGRVWTVCLQGAGCHSLSTLCALLATQPVLVQYMSTVQLLSLPPCALVQARIAWCLASCY